MSRHYTDQDRIDEQTMRIENPNVVGSGYIQFPPQRPFEKPVQVQPPTVAHLDYPHEYQSLNGSAPAPQAASQQRQLAAAVHGPQVSTSAVPQAARLDGTSLPAPHYATQPAQTSGRPAASQTQTLRQPTGATYQSSAAGHSTAPRPQQHQQQQLQLRPQQQPQPRAQQQQYVPASPGPRTTPQGPQSAPVSQPRPTSANGYHIPAPQSRPAPSAMAAPAAAARPQPSAGAAQKVAQASPDDAADGAGDTSQLTKAQKQRLRKKLREGRV